MRVLIFGVFDLLHPGHGHFISESAKLGDELVVVVARDAGVEKRKGRLPEYNETKRLAAIRELSQVAEAELSDEMEGNYEVVKKFRPDIIALGHDQQALRADLMRAMKEGIIPGIKLVEISAHEPDKFKTSKLRRFTS
jgi:FAD synthetase